MTPKEMLLAAKKTHAEAKQAYEREKVILQIVHNVVWRDSQGANTMLADVKDVDVDEVKQRLDQFGLIMEELDGATTMKLTWKK